jgi:hypothetical protein
VVPSGSLRHRLSCSRQSCRVQAEIPLIIGVQISRASSNLDGDLSLPEGAQAVILFAHGSGSSRHSSRNRYVAQEHNTGGLATLLLDLLTPAEEAIDARTAHLRFDIPFLAERLVAASDWLTQNPDTGIFQSAALVQAQARPPHW